MIIVDNNGKKFILQCSFSDNQWVKALPNIRFRRAKKWWEAPCVARNVDAIVDLARLGRAKLTQAAQQKVEEMEEMKVRRRSSEPFPAWYPFKTQPRDLQTRGLNAIWSLNKFALLCEMGTGKSKMYIDYFSAKIMNDGLKTVIMFCPISIRDNWVEEVEKHCPIQDLNVCVIDPQDKSTIRTIERLCVEPEPLMLICGVESVQQFEKRGTAYETILNVVTREERKPYAALVDESHFIQNHETNRWLNIAHLSMNAAYRGIATGTPTDGRPTDYFAQFEFLDPEILGFGNYHAFKSRYTVKGGFEGRQVVGYQNVDELMELIQPYTYQALKDSSIPDKIYMPVRWVSLGREQQRLADDLLKKGVLDVNKTGNPDVALENVLAVHTMVQQICCGILSYWEEYEDEEGRERRRRVVSRIVNWQNNPKIREMRQVIKETRGKILIWCKYRMEIEDVVYALEHDYGADTVCQYHGGQSKEERKEHMRAFKEDDNKRFFVLMSSVGGTGLTINEAKYAIYMSNSFKLRERLQSEDRNHRIGQEDHVTYIDIGVKCKVERNILKAIEEKKDLADYLRSKLSDLQALLLDH